MDKNEITPINRDFLQGVSKKRISQILFSQFALLQEQITDENGGEDK